MESGSEGVKNIGNISHFWRFNRWCYSLKAATHTGGAWRLRQFHWFQGLAHQINPGTGRVVTVSAWQEATPDSLKHVGTLTPLKLDDGVDPVPEVGDPGHHARLVPLGTADTPRDDPG